MQRLLSVLSFFFFLAAAVVALARFSPTIDRLVSRVHISTACKYGSLLRCEAVAETYASYKWADLAERAGDLACERGSLMACIEAGKRASQHGNQRKASQYGQFACNKGEAKGCLMWGQAGRALNDVRAETFGFHSGCFKFGIGEACVGLAEIYLSGNQKANALLALKRGCAESDSRSCDRLREIPTDESTVSREPASGF